MTSISDMYVGRYALGVETQKRELGPFSAFMNPERQQAVHRINMEEIARQTNAGISEVNQRLDWLSDVTIECTKQTLKALDWLNDTNDRMLERLNEIKRNSDKNLEKLDSVIDRLDEMLHALRNPASIRAAERARQAAKNLANARQLQPERAKRLVTEAREILMVAVEDNPLDYKALFDLGWIELFFTEDFSRAVDWFERSVDHSLVEAQEFAAYSLRHCAEAQRLKKDYSGAVASLEAAIKLPTGYRQIANIELVEVLVERDGLDQVAQRIVKLVETDSAYFELLAGSQRLAQRKGFGEILKKLLDDKLKHILSLSNGRGEKAEYAAKINVSADITTKIFGIIPIKWNYSRDNFSIPDGVFLKAKEEAVDRVSKRFLSSARGNPFAALDEAAQILKRNVSQGKGGIAEFAASLEQKMQSEFLGTVKRSLETDFTPVFRFVPGSIANWVNENSQITVR